MTTDPLATVEECVARHLAAKEWLTTDDGWDTATPSFRADYLAHAREVIALVQPAAPVPPPAPTDRAALSAKLWAVAEQHIVAEWICCEPVDPKHELCAKGQAALGMARSLLVDADPAEAWNPAAPLLDAVLDELRRMAVEAPAPNRAGGETPLMRAHVALAEQAGRDQAAIARVRAYLDSQTDAFPEGWPVAVPAADVLAALDSQTSTEQPAAVSQPGKEA